jgi:hypothetical protein
MLRSLTTVIMAASTITTISVPATAVGQDAQLPPCPIRGSDIVEDHDCTCTKEARRAGGNLHGSGPYLWYSNVCMAAMHAGVTGPDGGDVRVEIRPPQSSYAGTLANGLFSADYGSSELSSFAVVPVSVR